MPDKLKKLENILEMIEKDNPSIDEVVEVVEMLLEKMNLLHSHFSSSLNELSSDVDTQIKGVINKIESNLKISLDKIRDVDESHTEKISKMAREIYVAIKEIEGAIPESVDLDPVYNKISEIENKIPKVPELPNGDQTVDLINSAERKINKTKIDGLEDEIRQLKELINSKSTGGGMKGMRKVPIIKRIDLTSQVDGLTRDFKLPKDTVEVLGLWGTQFPITFNSSDWTFQGNTLTLASGITTPESGQSLMVMVEVLFYG